MIFADPLRAGGIAAWRLAGVVSCTAGAGILVVLEPFAVILLAASCLICFGLAARFSGASVLLAGMLIVRLALTPLEIAGQTTPEVALVADGIIVVLVVKAIPRIVIEADLLTVLIGAFIGLSLLQAFNPILPSIQYGLTGARLLILPVLLVEVVRRLPMTDRDISLIVVTLAFGWACNLALALKQWVFGHTAGEMEWLSSLGSSYIANGQLKLMGAMPSGQDFGLLAGLASAVVIVAALQATDRRQQVALGVLGAASIAVLTGSMVRSAFVASLAAVASYALMTQTVSWKRVIGGICAVTIALAILGALMQQFALAEDQTAALQKRVLSVAAVGDDLAIQARQQETWPQAIREIKNAPMGAGAGAAGPLSAVSKSEAPLGELSPDNGTLLIAVQLGLLGALILWAIVLVAGLHLKREMNAGSRLAAWGFVAGIVLATAMLAGGFWSLVAPQSALAVLVGLGLRTDVTRG